MIDGLEEIGGCIQDALDELCSPRSSSDVKTKALERLEKQIATSCLSTNRTGGSRESWDHFLALQYTFECNVPSRLITWISVSTTKLEHPANKGTADERILASQLTKALSIIQGIALSHDSSKIFLGRKYSLEVLLELLLASRHLTPPNDDNRSSSTRNKQPADLPLTSTVLDTLLCILVDSPEALRGFESVSGIQAVVKILKRAGTPREVRMKCLEFLYFYLLDETAPTDISLGQRSTSTSSTFSNSTSYPGTPSHPRLRLSKPSLNPTPLRPLSRHGSGSSELSSSSSSSRSTSGSSIHSFTSISSVSTPITPAPSKSPSPEKPVRLSQLQSISKMPLHTPPSTLKFASSQPQRNIMMMLKKEVDYEPLSPKKPGFPTGLSTPSRPRAQTHGQLYTPSRSYTHTSQLSMSVGDAELRGDGDNGKRKTTEEKKQLLGTMLGNVDALVEGVRKAGIWGLA
ncbi:hypothetical protein P691DRAFT_665953 [Macrolepiota fuliginosa MF-IS2]|uniref:Cell division control protein 14 n=1 Tax=Macrolepiota fuliginosa MF-IS2 TaxID=1400762 RepID=A0A9P5XI42_9AGAR|nr:hypothetical protein P691DRAFT_665953 [Macrolepiota fuliginosa MF-IS2]